MLASGSTYIIEDFRELQVNGEKVLKTGQDKGHSAEARYFRDTLRGGERPTSPVPSMRATLLAAFDLGTATVTSGAGPACTP